MTDSFRERLEEEVPAWVDEGIVEASQARQILERYEGSGPSQAGVDATSAVLYGTAAVLLGAAAIALVFVGLDPDSATPLLFGVGAALTVGGLGLHLLAPGRDLLADVLFAAALAPLAAGPLAEILSTGEALAYGLPAILLPAAYLVLRREQPFLPTLSVVGFATAMHGVAFDVVAEDAASATYWMVGQALLVAGLVAVDRLLRSRDADGPVGVAVAALGISLVVFLFETVDVGSSVTLELVLGAIMVAVLTVGALLRHRGLVVGAGVVLGVDAIVFAFDLDEVFGIALLVVLGGLVVWQAETLRGWLARTGRAGS